MFILVEFTEDELKAQLQLNHRALLHSGADVADVAVHLKNKYSEATLRARSAMGKANGKAEEETSAVTSNKE